MIKKNLWEKRQEQFLNVFRDALPLLYNKSLARTEGYINEDDISRDLYFSVQKIIFSDKYIDQKLELPSFQTQNQPDALDRRKVKREDKRPDFLWSYVDYANRQRLDFTVECKRIRKDKKLHCKEYVMNGLFRFLEKEWSYGLNCKMGLMIGYVEDLSFEECVESITENLTQNNIPSLQLLLPAVTESSFYVHLLTRKSIKHSPFNMHHYLIRVKNTSGHAKMIKPRTP